MGECCLSPGGPAAFSPASEGLSGLRRRILGCRQRGNQQMDTVKPVCCCEASEPLIIAVPVPFICSLRGVPTNSPGLWFGAFISSALSETFTKARKQTGSFVFIATQTAFPGS